MHGQKGIETCACCTQTRANYILYSCEKQHKFDIYIGIEPNEIKVKQRIQNLIDTSCLHHKQTDVIEDESFKLTNTDIETLSDMLTEKIPGSQWQVCSSGDAAELLSNPQFNQKLYDDLTRMDTIPKIGEILSFKSDDLLPFKLRNITMNTHVKVEATWEWHKIETGPGQLKEIFNEPLSRSLMSTKVSTKKQSPVNPETDCIKVGNDYYGVKGGLAHDVYLKAIECTTYEENMHTKAEFYKAISKATKIHNGVNTRKCRFLDFMIYLSEQPDIVLLVKKTRVDFDMDEVLIEVVQDVEVLKQIVEAMQSTRAEMQIILEIVLLMVNTLGNKTVVAVDLLCFREMEAKKTNDGKRNVTYYAALLYYDTFVSPQLSLTERFPDSRKLNQLISAHAVTLNFNVLTQNMTDVINKITALKISIEDKHQTSCMIRKMAEMRTNRIDPLAKILNDTQAEFVNEKKSIEPEEDLKRSFDNYVKPGGFFTDMNLFLVEFLRHINSIHTSKYSGARNS